MKITKTDRLQQLAFMPGWFPVNCYLVEEDDDLTLVDAGMPFSVRGIQEAVRRTGKSLGRIVLTHAHSDHIGALQGLKRLLPEVPVLISERDSRLLAGDVSLRPGEPQTPVKGGVPKRETVRPDVLLQEGDLIGSLKAIASPGHTPGSMSFLDQRNGNLIVGDAFQTRGRVAVSGQLVPSFPFPAMATWSKELALASAVKLAELQPEWMAAGHGLMIQAPGEAMQAAIRDAKRRLGTAAALMNTTD